jgi:phosphatidylethanolamine-binding protein
LIGDVVDLFVPSVAVLVRFGTKGCEIKLLVPAVHIAGWANNLFIMVRTQPPRSSSRIWNVMFHLAQTLSVFRTASW